MPRTTLRAKGQLTLPTAIRKAAHLEEGDPIDVDLVDGQIILRPRKLIDPSQAWFWTPEWQEGEREASKEAAAGLGRIFYSGEEFLAELVRMSNPSCPPSC
jgi:AbrB family looped-hinge helix DNA binding protein